MPIDDIEFRNAIFNFSITVTSKCNLKCSYCHFYEYGKHKNHEEISQKLFEKYVQFLEWLKIKNYNISYRFSGGEPLTIGERIFDLAQYSTERLKIAPYVMTNGLLLNEYVVAKSKNRISAYVVSMENPFDVDKGSIKSEINIKKIRKYSSNILPIIPGAVIIRNSQFKNLLKIADYFYEEIGRIPLLTELNYGAFESPSEAEIYDLYNGVRRIVEKYKGLTRLRLFPYIVPEYLRVNSKKNEFITELNYENKYDILNNNFNDTFDEILNTINNSYIDYTCPEVNCDWYNCCRRIKWVWLHQTNNIPVSTKIADYCKMKKAISNAYYDAITLKNRSMAP